MEYDSTTYDSAEEELKWKIRRLEEKTVVDEGLKQPFVHKGAVLTAIENFFEEGDGSE